MEKYVLLSNGNIKVTLQVSLARQSGRTRIFDAAETHMDEKVVAAFARARRWQRLIDEGKYASSIDLARNLGVDGSYVARIMRLNWVSPRIVRSFIKGTAPCGVSIGALVQPLPASWEEQEKKFGYPEA